ncbi:MAG: radical SAM protein, partial [Candidatus Aenigmatarchaeota archaeon]
MKEIIDSLSMWQKNGKGYPIQIQIHPTNYCNLNCIFCPTRALVKELDRKKELTKEEWLKIIDEGNRLGVREWHICGGGEPLFFTEDALTIMKKIKKSGKYGELITNGTFFQEEVARELVEMEWDKIYISLDSPNQRTNDFLRGKCYQKIIEGVKNLVKWKKKLQTKKPSLYFHSVICNKNYKQIPGLMKLTRKLNLEGVCLNALNIWKPEIDKLKLNEKEKIELKKILKRSEKIASE